MLLDADDQFASDCSDKKRPLIAVWGDSTAAALTPGLRHAQKQRNFGLAQFTVSSCPPLLVNVHSMSELCIERNKKIVDLIGSISPQTVILHAIWDNNDTVESTRPTIDALRAKGVKNIVILGPVPVWPGGITNAYATYYRRTGALLPERTSLFVAPTSADERMSEIANILDVRYISARSALCNDSGCLTRVGTEPLVADALHLTEAGSNILADAVVSKLSALARIETQE
ncbi:MAG: SGNH hydrolase domain-containing protein [Nitrobacter sp.]